MNREGFRRVNESLEGVCWVARNVRKWGNGWFYVKHESGVVTDVRCRQWICWSSWRNVRPSAVIFSKIINWLINQSLWGVHFSVTSILVQSRRSILRLAAALHLLLRHLRDRFTQFIRRTRRRRRKHMKTNGESERDSGTTTYRNTSFDRIRREARTGGENRFAKVIREHRT